MNAVILLKRRFEKILNLVCPNKMAAGSALRGGQNLLSFAQKDGFTGLPAHSHRLLWMTSCHALNKLYLKQCQIYYFGIGTSKQECKNSEVDILFLPQGNRQLYFNE